MVDNSRRQQKHAQEDKAERKARRRLLVQDAGAAVPMDEIGHKRIERETEADASSRRLQPSPAKGYHAAARTQSRRQLSCAPELTEPGDVGASQKIDCAC